MLKVRTGELEHFTERSETVQQAADPRANLGIEKAAMEVLEEDEIPEEGETVKVAASERSSSRACRVSFQALAASSGTLRASCMTIVSCAASPAV